MLSEKLFFKVRRVFSNNRRRQTQTTIKSNKREYFLFPFSRSHFSRYGYIVRTVTYDAAMA